ncbi:hypothetical protein CPLU01_11548 [Colletotrichum plurivorum]|uniref:Uncharacterized protein n=1 Tax=Colletotrichum plurivorum TaxID=2175906 RepID=A0A8H6K2I1_9PEZI|nr:hypothetical protein CPLU01_11548 [Colletotrichum plurivorum]
MEAWHLMTDAPERPNRASRPFRTSLSAPSPAAAKSSHGCHLVSAIRTIQRQARRAYPGLWNWAAEDTCRTHNAQCTAHDARRLTQALSPSPQQPPSRNQLLRFALRKIRLPGSRKLLAPRKAAERFLLRYLERQCRAGVA